MKYILIAIFNLLILSLANCGNSEETIDEFAKRFVELFKEDNFEKYQKGIIPSKEIIFQLHNEMQQKQIGGQKQDDIEKAVDYQYNRYLISSSSSYKNLSWRKIKIGSNFEPIIWKDVLIHKTESEIQILNKVKGASAIINLSYKGQPFTLKFKGLVLDIDGKWKLTKTTKFECSCISKKYKKRELYSNALDDPQIRDEYARLNKKIQSLNGHITTSNNQLKIGFSLLKQKKTPKLIMDCITEFVDQNKYLDSLISILEPHLIYNDENVNSSKNFYLDYNNFKILNSRLESQLIKYEEFTKTSGMLNHFSTFDKRSNESIDRQSIQNYGHYTKFYDAIFLKEYKQKNTSILLQILFYGTSE